MIILNISKLKESNKKALRGLWDVFPIIFGVLLLVSMLTIVIPKSFYGILFNGNLFRDSITGAMLGSVLTGNPVTGYIIGKGFLVNGVSLIAVVSFITAWTTVGLFQLPAESLVLGKRFAVVRNISAFIISIVVAVTTVMIINIL